MAADRTRWQPKPGVESPHLRTLLAAWRGWAREDGMPRRTRFDPFEFPPLLPLMVLAEIIDQPSPTRAYDVMYRYIGSEFSTFFDAGKVTRARLSEIGPPFDERWFAVADPVMAAASPCFFEGAPYGTAYEHVSLEMLALPLARPAGETGFILCAFARSYPET
ncbi:MAG: PAS domain-containing protein [Rhodospirillaceae bacterium]|nr:PAS domain-containing protein [Rhodospirillaceae bacterium]